MSAFDRPSRGRDARGDAPALPVGHPFSMVSTASSAADREIRPLVRLCRAIAQAGFTQVTIRDALPRLILRGPGGVWVDVRVAEGGTEFVWGSGVRHPVTDVAGAAQALIAFMADGAGRSADDG